MKAKKQTEKVAHHNKYHNEIVMKEYLSFFLCTAAFSRVFLKLKIVKRNIDFDIKILKKYLVKAQLDKAKNAPSENIFTPL